MSYHQNEDRPLDARRVTVDGTSPKLVIRHSMTARLARIENLSTTDEAYIGGPDVSTLTGKALAPASSATAFDGGDWVTDLQGSVYAIAPSGKTVSLSVQEQELP